MKEVTTKDGSITFHNEEYDETYHSTSGAKEEAVKKFAEPSNFKELVAKQKMIKILDVCFGLGYNSAAAIDEIRKYSADCKIIIFALESDDEILKKTNEVNPEFDCYEIIRDAANYHNYNQDNIEITLLLGDARETIQNIAESEFDCVFLDSFSPKKCPELWTEEFFKDISALVRKGGILTTYSCAGSVRKNLESASFEVRDGPCVGRKAPSTIAIKQ
ncbi:tRNA (5-methylaminomethyl-2-thiouridine)(34)-methyltransferase MnmD [Nanoarchaeota archaeon]